MKILHILCLILSVVFAAPALAQEQPTTKLEMVEQSHHKGMLYSVKLTDIKTGKPVTEDDLKTVHTKKLHLLVIDPSLTEYHHVHPTLNQDGTWDAYWAEAGANRFRVWADITRKDTGRQEFVMTDIGAKDKIYKIDKTLNSDYTVGEYSFSFKLDGELKAGEAAMATITVTKNGKPFDQLEPVMGAFAHLVGFNEDYKTIMHIHPMGKEPEKDIERGGPELQFHIEPEKAGYNKLFAQFRIDGNDVFVPFGIMVNK